MQALLKFKKIVFIAVFSLVVPKSSAQELSEKANAFLSLLSEDLKTATLFSLEDKERYNFNYVPIARKGPTFHDFDNVQKTAALALLKASLSEEGFNKTQEIMELENVLIVIENNRLKMPDGSPMRDPLNYHFSIFGNPSAVDFWGWRFEGHHISLNFTSTNGKIVSSTPSFMGSNPGVVKEGSQKGKQVLKKETKLGLALINALSEDQRSEAIFSDNAPAEIITGNQRKVHQFESAGIAYPKLSEDQKKLFMELLEVYIGNYIFDFSHSFRDKIKKAGIENLHFAWAGALREGLPHYYRIHGPMLLIEYDNIQNNANHVHTVVRDLTNDFAEDLLSEHYKQKH